MIEVPQRSASLSGALDIRFVATLIGASLLVLNPAAIGAVYAQNAPVPSRAVAAPQRMVEAPASHPAVAPDADSGTRSVAARARMNECGHQWNNMKHAGTASGTWKEFSRGCLAQK